MAGQVLRQWVEMQPAQRHHLAVPDGQVALFENGQGVDCYFVVV
jgi:hypothetical protein